MTTADSPVSLWDRLSGSRAADLERECRTLRAALAEHAATVLAREAAVAEREAVVRSRDATIAQLARDNAASSAALSEHAATVLAREATIVECEAVVAAREKAILTLVSEGKILRADLAEHAATVLAREATIAECEAAVVARENTVLDRERTIREYESRIGRLEAELSARETTPATDGRDGHTARWSDVSEETTDDAPPEEQAMKLPPSSLTPAETNRLLAEWRVIASRYDSATRRGGQGFIEPYLVEKTIHDRMGRIVVATHEGFHWYDNLNETETPNLLRFGMLRRGDTVFDCGANQGIHSLSYARAVGPLGRVVAFDPFALNIDIGRFNARLNDIDNIDFIRAGLSDQASRLIVSTAEQCVGVPDTTADDAVAVTLVPLDMFASLKPSYLKIDIEGAEVNALEGAHDVLANEPAIYIEIHPQYLPRFNRSPMDIFKHILPENYAFHIHYPGIPYLSEYKLEFEIIEGCALYCVPKSRHAIRRHHASATA